MFYSILFPTREQHQQPRNSSEPDCFVDLNLDQIFAPILTEDKGFGVSVKKGSDLESFFYTPLQDKDTIVYRQEVAKELEDDGLCALIMAFVHKIKGIEEIISEIRNAMTSPLKWHDNFLVRGRLLEFTEKYSAAITELAEALSGQTLRSAGLRGFADYLASYIKSKEFSEMCAHARRLREKLSSVEYCMNIKFPTIRIRRYEGQEDLGGALLSAFSKFRQEDTEEYQPGGMSESQDYQTEATLLNMVAVVYEDIFADLDSFFDKYSGFDNDTILRFFREIQFYLSWQALIAPLKQKGLPFCYPIMCADASHLYSRDGFDLALAYMNRHKADPIVTNDFTLTAPERILVITGPNQGGKTTFARAFGQMHYLAALGLCVPGREAALYLFDNILTHFEREEDLSTLSGKLQDDLVRLRDIMDKATERSIVIVNEIFGSTTFKDASALGRRMMKALCRLEAPALVVTFIDELAVFGPETVSMMSTVSEEDPARRTFKILRKPPDGLAYAMCLATKHGLAYEQISGRLTQ
jgi:DNA mismatch repair ATPase MutS